jgi:hypothetical protein
LTEGVSPLEKLVPDIPAALAKIVNRCLKKDAEERFQSLEDVVAELEPLRRDLQQELVAEIVQRGKDLVDQCEFSKAQEVLRDVLLLDSTHNLA